MSAIVKRRLSAPLGQIPRPRPSPDRDHPRYRLHMSKQGAAAFGAYLANFIAHSGRFPNPTALAREAGVHPAALSRYINGHDRPSPRTLEKLAPCIGASVADLVAIAYPEHRGEPAGPAATADPLVAELAAMLANDSPLSAADRETARTLVDRVIDPYRRQMRRRRSA